MLNRKKTSKFGIVVNLDSLMDVLTCAVGIMLFVVIFTVIEARGVSFKFFTPMQKGIAPEGKTRNLFICKNGKIKFLNINMAYDSLMHNVSLTYNNIPRIVELANKRNTKDEYFNFTYNYRDEEEYWYYNTRRIIIIIDENDPYGGDDAETIKTNDSPVSKIINSLDTANNWIAFAIQDEKSLDVFREARNLAIKKGISNGWDPLKVEFPFELSGGGGNSEDCFGCPQK